MTCLGFRTAVMEWFKGYLSNRKLSFSVDYLAQKLEYWTVVSLRGLFWNKCILMTSVNHYQKMALIFILMIRVYYTKTKKIKTKTKKIEDLLNKKLSTLWRWFVDNSLSIHSGEDKTKYILFSDTKGLSNLNISYADHITKQYSAERFLGCYLGSK